MVSQQITDFIKSNLRNNVELAFIEKALSDEGWQNSIIQENIQVVKNDPEYSQFFKQAVSQSLGKPSQLLVRIGALICVLLVGGGSIYAYTRYKGNTDLPIAHPIDTTNWQTYTSTSGSPGYTIKIPSSWEVREKNNLTAIKISDNSSLHITRQNNVNGFVSPFVDVKATATTHVLTKKDLTLNGSPAKQIEVHDSPGKPWETYVITTEVLKNSTSWEANYQVNGPSSNQDIADNKAVYLQVISSFQPE